MSDALRKARRKAAYDLTGTHDPDEQKAHWEEVFKIVKELQEAKRKREFKRKLKGY